MKSILNERKSAIGSLSDIFLIGITLTLAACGEKPPSPQPASSKLFQQERGALEKAKGVKQSNAKSAEDLKQEAEKQAQ